MGFGDEILGSGIARGARTRGKRIAFGNGRRIIWSKHAPEIFRNNPNVARPGCEGSRDLEWIAHYPGHRLYAHAVNGLWQWNSDFRATPGEIFLDRSEKDFAEQFGYGFVLIEPHCKPSAPNKRWPFERFQTVADELKADGYRVLQFAARADVLRLKNVEIIPTPTFRMALAALSHAKLYIGPEGGLHHGAAALNVRAVVIFGGFIHPRLTGYSSHKNLFVGEEGCGTIGRICEHCRAAMAAITVDQVLSAALETMNAARLVRNRAGARDEHAAA